MQKRGEHSGNTSNLLPPVLYSLLQPLEEHAGRLKRGNSELFVVVLSDIDCSLGE